MGMRITCPDEGAPCPRPTVLELSCDGDHGLFAPEPAAFADAGGFMDQHRAAMDAGWLERIDGGRGRVWIGPCCSGKKAR